MGASNSPLQQNNLEEILRSVNKLNDSSPNKNQIIINSDSPEENNYQPNKRIGHDLKIVQSLYDLLHLYYFQNKKQFRYNICIDNNKYPPNTYQE